MNYETARANMITQQIRCWHVLGARTLEALERVRREHFVAPQHHPLAFAEVQIPLGHGEVMLEPNVGARMLEALALQPDDRVLEVGSGSGYLTALLATLGAHVTSVEIHPELHALAGRNLAAAGFTNLTLECADAHAGWGDTAAFDVILLSGSLPAIDDAWCNRLAEGGRLVGIEGHAPAMEVVLLTRAADGVRRRGLFETVAPRLRGVSEPHTFEF